MGLLCCWALCAHASATFHSAPPLTNHSLSAHFTRYIPMPLSLTTFAHHNPYAPFGSLPPLAHYVPSLHHLTLESHAGIIRGMGWKGVE